jgi:hypothetical protein
MVRVPKIKKDLPRSKIGVKPICSIGLPKWREKSYRSLVQRSWKKMAWHGFLNKAFKLRRMVLKQVVQQRQKGEESRNNCQVGGLH